MAEHDYPKLTLNRTVAGLIRHLKNQKDSLIAPYARRSHVQGDDRGNLAYPSPKNMERVVYVTGDEW